MPGNFCHIEIKVKDLKIAQDFYGKIFNWKFEEMEPKYLSFSTGNGVGGGLELNEKDWPDGPITLYIKVDDIPATLKQITPAGGKIVKEKTEIGGDFGFYALFRDPFSNLLGLWSKT